MKKCDYDISFFIDAYNEEEFIGEVLDHLVKPLNVYKRAEVLIGVDGNDNTYKIAKKYSKKIRNLRIWKFKKRMGRRPCTNFLIDKAKSDIVVNHDCDYVLRNDVKIADIVKEFKNPKVGGLIFMATGIREQLNPGQKLFEDIWHEVKLEKYLKNNIATNSSMFCHIFRKSAIKKPYFETVNEDSEATRKLMMNGYDVVYVPKLAKILVDNSHMPPLKPMDIINRRVRSETYRDQAPQILNTNEFKMSKRIGLFLTVFARTTKRATPKQFLGMIEYLTYMGIGIAYGRIKLVFSGKADSLEGNAWKSSRTR